MKNPRPKKLTLSEQRVLKRAARIREEQTPTYFGDVHNPTEVKNMCGLMLMLKEREEFWCFFLTSQFNIIEKECLSIGTIDGASVHPREVVKRALELNAAAVIFTHNHPSGDATPSIADKRITQRLVDALQLVDIRVLDHIVVGHPDIISFAERGLL